MKFFVPILLVRWFLYTLLSLVFSSRDYGVQMGAGPLSSSLVTLPTK